MPLLILLLYPFVELYAYYIFISKYSFGEALLITLSSGLLGLFIMVTQGRAAIEQLQTSMMQQKLPTSSAFHRGVLVFGGLLFFIPGLINDFLAFFFILPGTRHLIVWFVKFSLAKALLKGTPGVFKNVFVFSSGFPGARRPFESSTSQSSERDATVVDITPTSIEHKNIKN